MNRWVARREPLAIVCIALAALVTFARALPYPLQRSWDDGRFILENADASHPSLHALLAIFSKVRFEAYHPLHLLSYWLDVPWFGPNPIVLHSVSLALFIGALCLLYAFMRALSLGTSSALLGTLLVGLHPAQVEAVSWATGRKDVLALLFASASLLLHVRTAEPWSRAAWLSRLCFVLAALAKTTTLPLPLFALALDLLVLRLRARDAWLRAAPSLVAALTLGVFTLQTWQQHEMVRSTLGGVLGAPLRWLGTLAHQLATACWPAHVSPMYSTQALSAPTLGWLLWPAALSCMAWLAWRARLHVVFAGLFGFVLLLLPASNLVPMYFPFQDRYLSLPLLGLGLASAALADAWSQRAQSQVPFVLMTALVAALALRTIEYQGVWASELRLWGHAASVQPDAQYAWLKLAELRRDAGELEGAIAADRKLVQVAPTYRLAWAALFEAVALRDERAFHIAPTRARLLAKTFYDELDDATQLRALAAQLLASGYLRALELPLAHSLALAPLPDAVLENGALQQLRGGRPSVARIYALCMQAPPQQESLRALLQQDYFPVLP